MKKVLPGILILILVFTITISSLIIPSKIYAATYDLTNDYNLRIDGSSGSQTGWYVVMWRDIDNNGVSDLVIQENSTRYLYIIFDSILENYLTIGSTLNLSDSNNYSIKLTSTTQKVNFVDINNDGKLDFLFGNSGDDTLGKTDNGAIFVVDNSELVGKPVGTSIDPYDSSVWSYKIVGADSGHRFGGDSTHYGDYDGDGLTDICNASYGADYDASNGGSVYIFSNTLLNSFSEGSVVDLSDPDNFNIRIDGAISGDYNFGLSDCYFIDIDNDNRDGVIAGGYYVPFEGRVGSGSVYVLPDNRLPAGTGKILLLSDVTNYAMRFGGAAAWSGLSLNWGTTNHVNWITNNGDDLFFSRGQYMSNSFLREHINDNGTQFDFGDSTSYTSVFSNVQSGYFNSIADYNNDGLVDIFTSDIRSDTNGTDTGTAYLVPNNVFASLSGTGNEIDITDTNNYTIAFEGDNTSSPAYISQPPIGKGDLNDDGKNDFLFASDWTAYNGSRSGSVWVVLNFPHSVNITSEISEYQSTTTQEIKGTISAPLSVMNIGGVQWSESNDPQGTWTECSADDGFFDSTSESYTCNVSVSSDGLKNIYVRSYDENMSYTAQSNYANISFNLDRISPADSFQNTDFELVKFSGGDLKRDEDRGSKYVMDNGTPIIRTDQNKPSLKFEKIGDDASGVAYYHLRITDTHSGSNRKKGNDYVWIDSIPHGNPSGYNKRNRDGVDIYYRSKGSSDYIEIDVEDSKHRLDGGNYYLRIRAYDKAGNFTDSEEVFLMIGDKYEKNYEGIVSVGFKITLQSIGSIPYESRYSRYYYRSNLLTLTGTANGKIVLKVDGETVQTSEANGSFKLSETLSAGRHSIDLNGVVFDIQIDPTRESFPNSLKL